MKLPQKTAPDGDGTQTHTEPQTDMATITKSAQWGLFSENRGYQTSVFSPSGTGLATKQY